ncbi:L-amino acid oxidase bordonein-L-like [Xenia sp. Carnegie-2017]|uniref:L-amino acid oxidase bordonein-L-like n=1 Tax=Xenia sp. Carnegie-2017 TaxID=2897299 RepID=UPI001F044773|nr:L-amino acid oxidase bordonein-L-like [Xenia sp. Carnegie-2017]
MASEYLKTRKRFWENDNSLKRPENNQVPIQLSELIKTFLKCIQEEGLQTAYNRYRYNPRETQLPRSVINATEDEKISDVIIVGAGMAGLSAAYELKKAGLSVTVLEQTDRYGGRIFTYGKESGLASGLYAEVDESPQKIKKNCSIESYSFEKNELFYFFSGGYAISSQFTLERFLKSNIDVIKAKVPVEDQAHLDLVKLGNLLPWSNDAVRGYSVFCYTEQLDQSLVSYLDFELGKWYSHEMHCLKGGMHSLPKSFFNDEGLSTDDIEYKKHVFEINYWYQDEYPLKDLVEVSCYSSNVALNVYNAKAVIVSTPINTLRQISFKPKLHNDESQLAMRKCVQAMEDVSIVKSTKIYIPTKQRFWENEGIKGGVSKTRLPIGQIHYVTPEDLNTKEGLVLIYTWKNEALLFGSMKEEQVKQKVMKQLAEIHPAFKEDMVTTCIVHAWYNQPSYQGAYEAMKASQHKNIRCA